MDDVSGTPAGGKTAEEILKSKAKIERARLKRVADREAAKKPDAPIFAGTEEALARVLKPKAKKKAAKPKAGKRLVKVAKQARKIAKKGKSAACVRFERLDMRLSKAEKTRVVAKAKKLRRTITSVVLEAVEKIR